MGLEVACKVMQLDRVTDEVHGVLLQGVEASIVAELSHPNIVRTFQIYHVRRPGSSSESSDANKLTQEDHVGLVAGRADISTDPYIHISTISADISITRGGRELWIVQELCRAGDLGQAIRDKVGVLCGIWLSLLVMPSTFLLTPPPPPRDAACHLMTVCLRFAAVFRGPGTETSSDCHSEGPGADGPGAEVPA